MFYLYLNSISFSLLILGMLISVAYLTLLERKLLGYIQNRKGPNKVGFIGLFQPFSDAIKLFSKEKKIFLGVNVLIYLISPMLMFLCSLMLWLIFFLKNGMFFFIFGVLFMFSVMGLSVYYIMFMGWSSDNNYSLIGGLRGVIQVVSYEISMVMFMLVMLTYTMSFDLIKFIMNQKNIWLLFNFSLFMMMMSSLLAEMSRTPFDFIEGESELVSGFNVEFGGYLFAFIFLSEYLMILFISYLMVVIFFSSEIFLFMVYKFLLLIFLIIWVRGSFPRYRYDKLMNLNWKFYLPISMNFLVFFFSLKLFIIYTILIW
uniref:NADH-ubiquinone oxidoreductase chain 1 n=1 Tax=Plectrocnemia tsukuiensis TaxID=623670 RepID=A0A9E8LNL5_9NEOP|nr:NADH dehydrogenase subunit 1 [Plectrocnemia tsukuiensis]UZZ43697.1 NADH dehydrogenase subunit 1 [Plectrocnemia tsukuiensis]